MQADTTIQTSSLPQPPYWTSKAAYELAESLERWDVDPDLKIYLATAYIAEHSENCWYIMIDGRDDAPPKTSLDLHIFEEDNARSLFSDIAKHFSVGIHRFDGRNFNVTVKSFLQADLMPMLPTLANQLANQRRRNLWFLIN